MTDLPPEISGVIGFYAGATNPSYEKSRGRKAWSRIISAEVGSGVRGPEIHSRIPFRSSGVVLELWR